MFSFLFRISGGVIVEKRLAIEEKAKICYNEAVSYQVVYGFILWISSVFSK